MKKNNPIRILLIALMFCLTLAIPLTAAAQTMVPVTEADATEPTIATLDDVSPVISSESEDVLANYHPAKEIFVSRDPGDCYLPIDYSESDPAEEAAASYSESAVAEENPAAEAEAAPVPSGCSYCGSLYHSYDRCAQRAIDNGAVGRWVVPSAGINVACYWTTSLASTVSEAEEVQAMRQAIVDAWDSAAITGYAWDCTNLSTMCGILIADHCNQEFSALKYVSVGMEAYMDYGSYQQKYVCTGFEYGSNDGHNIMDADGNYIYNKSNPGEITCYTCNGNWQNVILVSFQPVSD